MKFLIKTKLSENVSETPDGFLLCRNVPLTHTGELVYAHGEHPFDDIEEDLTVTRPAEVLFAPETIASFEAKVITIRHPQDLVTPETYRDVTHGTLMNVRKSPEKIEVDGKEEDALLGDFLLMSKEAIERFHAGMREVSLGYDALWTLTDEKARKAIHSKITGNHVALVDEGRAGIQCSINDHKKENETMDVKLKEKLDKFKSLFGKTVDEAVKEKEDEQKAKDEAEAKKAKDEEEAAAKKKKEDEASDEGEDSDLAKRVAALEENVKKILAAVSGDEEVEESKDGDEEEEESEDEGEESDEIMDEEAGDEDEGEEGKGADSVMTAAEILAPGITKTKDVKLKALTIAYKTKDGKKVIDKLTGGKAPSKENANVLFVAASELLKSERRDSFAAARTSKAKDHVTPVGQSKIMTADDINKKNAERYGKKQ